jgi:hypothetical protein
MTTILLPFPQIEGVADGGAEAPLEETGAGVAVVARAVVTAPIVDASASTENLEKSLSACTF